MIEGKINSLREREAGILGQEDFFKSAVLVPLIKSDSGIKVLFEKRASHLDHQPGEICFPGGGIEKCDGSPVNAAIRETCEELGLLPEQIEVVAPLDVLVSPLNLIVVPFLAYINNPQQIKLNQAEVEKTFQVPLEHFLQNDPEMQVLKLKLVPPDNYPYELIPHGRNYPWRQGIFRQFFYFWEDEVIWGLTAYILHNFIKLVQK